MKYIKSPPPPSPSPHRIIIHWMKLENLKKRWKTVSIESTTTSCYQTVHTIMANISFECLNSCEYQCIESLHHLTCIRPNTEADFGICTIHLCWCTVDCVDTDYFVHIRRYLRKRLGNSVGILRCMVRIVDRIQCVLDWLWSNTPKHCSDYCMVACNLLLVVVAHIVCARTDV